MGTRQSYLSRIRVFDDPALKAVCGSLAKTDDLSFLKDLRKTCGFTVNGVGMAAPQIGVLKRAFFLWPGRAGFGHFILNPELVGHSDDRITEKEGCLSYPGVEVPVERYYAVSVQYFDERWEFHVRTFTGMAARIVQHEMDHLDGVCLVGDAWRQQNAGTQPSTR